jgi:hypothetical protein
LRDGDPGKRCSCRSTACLHVVPPEILHVAPPE